MTLEQAQAACEKKGGLLMIIYTQKLTLAGAGPEEQSPGDCISPSKFDTPTPASAAAPAPASNSTSAPAH